MTPQMRAEYIAATAERRAPSTSSLSSNSVRDCRLSRRRGPRHRVPAPVAVVTGRGTEALAGGTPTSRAMLKRDRKRRAAKRSE